MITPPALHPTVHGHVLALAQCQPDAPAVYTANESWRWAELGQRLHSAASTLQAQGLVAGDRLLVVSETSASALVLCLAAQLLGAWPAVINARLPWAEVQRLVDLAEPRWLLFSTEGSKAAATLAQAAGATPCAFNGLGPICAVATHPKATPEPLPAEQDQGVALMIFTSGTTGQPKAVMLSHAGLMNMARVVGHGRRTQTSDTINVAAPLSHVMGVSSVLAGLYWGAAVRLQPRLAPKELAQAIARGEIQQASMVPVAWVRLLEAIRDEGIDLSQHRLRALVSGGAALDPALKTRIEAVFDRRMVNAYGMTENAPMARQNLDAPDQLWSVGPPEPTVQIRILNAQGEPVTGEAVGRIEARSPSTMLGYYRHPEATAECMREGGWCDTGDLGHWLPGGELAVVGRAKEMIIRAGFNVYPAEVEGALASHPAVLHAAVMGEAAGFGDEAVVAFIQLRPGAALAAADVAQVLDPHCRTQLAPYKCPSRYTVVDDMPLGATGKILKRELQQQLATHPSPEPRQP